MTWIQAILVTQSESEWMAVYYQVSWSQSLCYKYRSTKGRRNREWNSQATVCLPITPHLLIVDSSPNIQSVSVSWWPSNLFFFFQFWTVALSLESKAGTLHCWMCVSQGENNCCCFVPDLGLPLGCDLGQNSWSAVLAFATGKHSYKKPSWKICFSVGCAKLVIIPHRE